MQTLNITYNGLSADYLLDLDRRATDGDVRRLAVEVIRSGGIPGLMVANLRDDAFDGHVVDRFDTKIYLRPKVPFG